MKTWTDKWSFVTGAVRKRDILYFVLVNDRLAEEEKPHAEFAVWHAGKWLDAGMVKWSSPSVAVVRQPREQMIAVGELGEAVLQGQGEPGRERREARGGIARHCDPDRVAPRRPYIHRDR